MKRNRIKVVSRFYFIWRCISGYQKAHFFTQAIGENRRLPLLFKQAGIIIFQFLNTVLQQIKKWNAKFAKTFEQPCLHPKMMGFWKDKCFLLLFMLFDSWHHILHALLKEKKMHCTVVCQYKVLLIDYCTVIINVGRK